MSERTTGSPINNTGTTHAATERKNTTWFTPVKKLCLLLVIISCLVYANTLYNGYVLDDTYVVTDNHYVKEGIKGIPELLITPHLKGYAPDITDTYRPLSLVMFAVEYQFFGEQPWAGHLFNVLAFAGCVLALFIFLHKLFDGRNVLLAFITALLFALHPMHTEVVANIKSRDELLCFFAFLALNMFIDYEEHGNWAKLSLGALFFFLSVISKETAATFLLVVPLVFFFYKNENKKRSAYITVATVAVTLLFITIRTIIINKYKADGMIIFGILDNQLTAAPDMSIRIATAILILGNYFKLLFWPDTLICDYSYHSIPLSSFADARVWAALFIYVALVITAIFLLYRNRKDVWAFGIIFYVITLSMFSNIAFIVGATQADRFTFFASAGICLLIALAINKLLLKGNEIKALKSWKALVLLGICVCYVFTTVTRNMDWKSNYTLFSADVQKSPDNTRLYTYLVTEMQKQYEQETDPSKKTDLNNECIGYLQKALAIYPENAAAHAELGTSYLLNKEIDSSIYHFKKAIDLDPKTLIAITNLGTLYSMQGKYSKAIPYYVKNISLEPSDTVTWFNLAICYMQLQKNDSAVYAFKRVITLDPSFNNYMSYANIAVVYKVTGQMDSAQKYLAIARQYMPAHQ